MEFVRFFEYGSTKSADFSDFSRHVMEVEIRNVYKMNYLKAVIGIRRSEGVGDKELEELKEAVDEARATGDRAHAQEELGDLLFTLVNVARWCQICPEAGLDGTNHRFLDRFSRVEAALGGDLKGQSIRDLEGLWQQAKAQIKAEAKGRTS